MSREFCIAFFVSLAAHASLVGICNPLHDRSEGEKGEEPNLVLLGIVELSAPAVPEVPPEPPPVQPPEEPIPTKPATPLPVVEPLPPAVDEQLALIASEPEETPVSPEELTEAPKPEPQTPTDKAVAEPPEQSEEPPAEVPMVEHHAHAGQQQLTSGQIEDLRSRYLRAVLEKLEKAKRYPRLAYRRGLAGTVELRFAVFRDGHASTPEVLQSSGYASLDAAAVEMVSRARPFHPIPVELKMDLMNLTIPVAFRIE